MRLIERQNIDILRWDNLVQSVSESSVFSLSYYLDNTAENWCIAVSDDYSYGIAIPYNIRLGIERCYTPVFVRYLEWFGDEKYFEMALKLIKERFLIGDYQLKSILNNETHEARVFQTISGEPAINTQARRMIQRAKKAELLVNDSINFREIIEIIKGELTIKIPTLDKESLNRLENLCEALKNHGCLKVLQVVSDHKIVGGILLVTFNESLLYLKGTALPDTKQKGGMYLVMHEAIQKAAVANCKFDFGGSNVSGVQRFNLNLGGKDNIYYRLKWNNSPWWFKLAKKINGLWRKK